MKKQFPLFLSVIAVSLLMTSCSLPKQIAREAKKDIFSNPDFVPAHVGISLYDPATQQYLYNYQADKYYFGYHPIAMAGL